MRLKRKSIGSKMMGTLHKTLLFIRKESLKDRAMGLVRVRRVGMLFRRAM